jgi:hypothetical protein
MKNMKDLVIVRSLIISAIALLMSGCTIPFFDGYGANHQSLADFKSHVEEIFRLQNQMSSEVIMLIESDGQNKHENLFQAEQKMEQACADLNEYASRDIDGLNISVFLQQRIEKSAIACEQAALSIKKLLNRQATE